MTTTNDAVNGMQQAVAGMNGAVRDAGTALRRLNRIALGMMRLRSLRPGMDEAEVEALATAVVDAWERGGGDEGGGPEAAVKGPETKWTPGPWTVDGGAGRTIQANHDGRGAVAVFYATGTMTYAEMRANAVLCAAAPEMAEALREAGETIEWLAPAPDDCKCSGDFRCVAHCGLGIVRAALARAGGR